MSMIPKKVGDKSFTQFVASCVMRDWLVMTPIGDCDRFDCVIDRGNGFERVQVKTGKMAKGSIRFPLASTHYHTKQGQLTKCFRKTYQGQIDLFGIFCPETGKCYIVPISSVGKREGSLRVLPVSSGSKTPRKWAKDYEI